MSKIAKFSGFQIDALSNVHVTLTQRCNGSRRERRKQECNGRHHNAIDCRRNDLSLQGSAVNSEPFVVGEDIDGRTEALRNVFVCEIGENGRNGGQCVLQK